MTKYFCQQIRLYCVCRCSCWCRGGGWWRHGVCPNVLITAASECRGWGGRQLGSVSVLVDAAWARPPPPVNHTQTNMLYTATHTSPGGSLGEAHFLKYVGSFDHFLYIIKCWDQTSCFTTIEDYQWCSNPTDLSNFSKFIYFIVSWK